MSEYASKVLKYALFIAYKGKIFDNKANEGNYMIKIALVEDEKNNLKEITSYLEKYSLEYNIALKVETFTSAVTFLKQYENNFDIVLTILFCTSDNFSAMNVKSSLDISILEQQL